MIVLATLLALAACCVLGAPHLLRLGRTAVRRPRLALGAWVAVFVLGALATVGSLLWSVLLGIAAHAEPVDVGWVAGVLAWGALAATGGAAALVLTRAEPLAGGRGAASRDLDLLAAACTERVERIGAVQVLFVRADRPVAFSSTSDGGRIVVTSGLAAGLSRSQLRAVIEHERAHLTGRHDLLLRLARLNRACLPALFGARAFDQAVHLLIELVADDAAARVCGATAVADALRRSAVLEPNEWAEIRAARLVDAGPRRAAAAPGAVSAPGLYKL